MGSGVGPIASAISAELSDVVITFVVSLQVIHVLSRGGPVTAVACQAPSFLKSLTKLRASCMPQIQVTLTPAESKRLIAKAVATLPEVKRALRRGTIVIGLGTTNASVAEELLGKKIDREKFVAGVILPKGTCVVPSEQRRGEIIIRRGKPIKTKLGDVLPTLTADDVFIKGANALDASGTAGVFLASRQGGTVGRVLGTVVARGVNLIIPLGLEKFIPGSIQGVSKTTGILRASYATGCPIGIMPLVGTIITELEAFEILTGGEAIPIGKGGISGAEGSITLLVRGALKQLAKARKLVNGIKGEPGTKVETECKTCNKHDCWYRKG